MAEACKELGPEAMHWAEQAELDSCYNPPNGYLPDNPPIGYNHTGFDALGYSQVYTTQEYDNPPGSFTNTQYYDANTQNYNSTSGQNHALQDFDPAQGYNYSAAPGYSQVQGSLGYEPSQNIGYFPSQAVYAPSSQNQQAQTFAAHEYQYHPTTSFPRRKRSNVLENAVDKQLQYDGSSRNDQKQQAEGANAVFTDHQGKETRVNLGAKQGR